MRYLWIVVVMLLAVGAQAQQWTATRTTTYDYSCTDEAGKVISGHTRIDAAFAACSNLSLKDGKTRFVVGGRYRIAATVPSPTGSATLSWVPPTQNTDGSALTDLAGYRILYGISATALTSTINVSNPAVSAYVVENLSAGSWYFCVKALNAVGWESACSNVATKHIS